MRRLLLTACLLTAAPTVVHADPDPHAYDGCSPCLVEFPNQATAPGQWNLYGNPSGGLATAYNPSTGQTIQVAVPGNVPTHLSVAFGAPTVIAPPSITVLMPGAVPNLWHGTGTASPPTVWGPNGAPGSNGAPAGSGGGGQSGTPSGRNEPADNPGLAGGRT